MYNVFFLLVSTLNSSTLTQSDGFEQTHRTKNDDDFIV